MADTTAADAGSAQISGTVPLYKQPEPLNLDQHGALGAKRIDRPFDFLKDAHLVPLTMNEFATAATAYPIIFAGSQRAPLAVMGLRRGENLFVDESGQIEPDIYVPAFVRRYPFVFANQPNDDRLVLCIDRAAPQLTDDNPDLKFFDGDKPSKATEDAIEFCKEFERNRRTSDRLVQLLDEMGLFEEKTVTYQPTADAESRPVATFFSITEDKVKSLDTDKVIQLRDNGVLTAVYAHMVSQVNWQRLIQKALRRQPAQAA